MDLKVYKKEEVLQPEGVTDVVTPNVIDIIPNIIGVESQQSIRNGVWNLDALKKIADVQIQGSKLIINSDRVTFENGSLFVTLTDDLILNADIVEGKEELEQACSLSTIWQRGNDPLALGEGVRWSELLLNEINVVQLMNDIIDAVGNITTSVVVVFDTVTASDGKSYLTYKLVAGD